MSKPNPKIQKQAMIIVFGGLFALFAFCFLWVNMPKVILGVVLGGVVTGALYGAYRVVYALLEEGQQ